jgi:uncharacterized protein involved in exopolysaccharide biosynthesis
MSTSIEHDKVSLHMQQSDGGIDIVMFSHLVWRYRILIASMCVLGVALAVVFGLVTTPIFRAEVVLAPAHEEGAFGGGGGSDLAGSLGGLASLAGVNLQEGNGSEAAAQGVLDSHHLVQEFIKRYKLLPVLSGESAHELTLWRATDRFKKNVVIITKDQKKQLTTVALEWKDAATAARWANDFVALANELVRTQAIDESKRNIAYLAGQVEGMTDIDMRKIMFSIIESETKRLMLANGRIEYAFQVIDPAAAPEVRVRPRRVLLVGIGFGLGLLVGITVALVMDRFARHGQRTPS